MDRTDLIRILYDIVETEFTPATIVEALSTAVALEITRIPGIGKDGIAIRTEEIALLDKTAKELREIVRKDR